VRLYSYRLGVITLTSTVPAAWPGFDGDLGVGNNNQTGTRVAPNLTAVAPVNPVPVMVTMVLPAVDPLVGETPVTVGAATYVNRSPVKEALVPPGVVTLTATVPAT